MTLPSNDVASAYRCYAEAFQDKSVVAAYRHRPPYPAEVFDILSGLIHSEPRHVLDVGCGRGEIARPLIQGVARLDAVDLSLEMIEHGRQLPNGNHPHLRWLHGRIEDAPLDPPYALITAGESLHWMDWMIVMPRFHDVLVEGGYLAIVEHRTTPDPWSILSEIIARYRTDQYHAQPHNTQGKSLFQQVGERTTQPIQFVQSIDDYVESYHSRAGFSRERMPAGQAEAFDQEARRALMQTQRDGVITLQVNGHIVWGFPRGK